MNQNVKNDGDQLQSWFDHHCRGNEYFSMRHEESKTGAVADYASFVPFDRVFRIGKERTEETFFEFVEDVLNIGFHIDFRPLLAKNVIKVLNLFLNWNLFCFIYLSDRLIHVRICFMKKSPSLVFSRLIYEAVRMSGWIRKPSQRNLL